MAHYQLCIIIIMQARYTEGSGMTKQRKSTMAGQIAATHNILPQILTISFHRYSQKLTISFPKQQMSLASYSGQDIQIAMQYFNDPKFFPIFNVFKMCCFRPKDDIQKILEEELYFLEQCLRINPKSYGTWHQRQFVLNTIPEPNWKRELSLCSKFLEFDDRNCNYENSHVWLYIHWNLIITLVLWSIRNQCKNRTVL